VCERTSLDVEPGPIAMFLRNRRGACDHGSPGLRGGLPFRVFWLPAFLARPDRVSFGAFGRVRGGRFRPLAVHRQGPRGG